MDFTANNRAPMRVTLTTNSEDETIALGEAVGRMLLPGDVVSLHGELGAGKTRLVRGIARGVGADAARVSSPTFVIMQEYRGTPGAAVETLVHIDAYRLGGADELESIGWERVARDIEERRPVAVIIEWAERIASSLQFPDTQRLDVRLDHAAAETRAITIEGAESWAARAGWTEIARRGSSSRGRPETRCPITGKTVSPDSPTYPFFDEHARMADLGRWMSGSYTVSRNLLPDDEEDAGLGGT